MAVTSGRVTTNKISKTTFYVEWQQSSQSTANNETYINWQAGINTGTSSSHDNYFSNAVKIYSVKINGTTVSNGGTWSNIKVGNDYQLLSGSATIPHNNDGTKSFTVEITAWTYSSSNYSGSDSFTLTNIPRQATADSVANFNDEENPVLKYTNNAGNAVTTLQACIALTESSAASNPAIAWRDISKTGNSYTFNLTTAERETLQNATTGQSRNLWFFVKTVLNGTTYYSYKIATMTIVNGSPTMNMPTYADTNGTTTAVTQNNQKIIQNKSTLQFQFANIEAKKGATLSKISMTINGVTKEKTLSGTSVASTTYDFGTIDVAENTTATITLTDSRGFTNNYAVQISVLEYFQPNAIISVAREANFYTESHITVDANYASLNGNNTITIQYRIKKSTDQSWGNWTTIQDNVEADFNADNQYMWDLQVQLTDILGTTTTYNAPGALDVGIPLVFYDVKKRSVGVNCMPEKTGSMEVNEVDVSNVYSTSETKCGYWIDGKPIYRKTFTQANTNDISTGVSTIDTMVKMECLVRQTTYGDWRNLPWLYVQGSSYGAYAWAGGFYYHQSDQKIKFQVGSDLGDIDKLVMIIEYTKTTD